MKRHWILALGVVALASLIAYRSTAIPFTHDEAGTWLELRDINVWSCAANAACWRNANNHWLNTLLLQWSASWFGDQPWALRLPNVLAGIGYLVCAALISTRYTTNIGLQCAAFLLLCGHVYLLDFFSVARGYGLMASGLLWGLYAMLRYIEQYQLHWLAISLVTLTLAILSNFTALLAWSAMAATWGVWLIAHGKLSVGLRHGTLWLVDAGVLLLLLYFPLTILAGSHEFQIGAAGPWMMMRSVMDTVLYGVHYFGNRTSLYALLALIGCAIPIALGGLLRGRSKRPPVLFMTLLLALNIAAVVLQHAITGALAPTGRRALYLIPFVFGFLAIGVTLIRGTTQGRAVGVLLSAVLILHGAWTLPLRSCREWYYDAYYPELIATLFPNGPRSADHVRLNTSWIFNPALRYYQMTIPLPISGLEYQKVLVIDPTMQYYFVELRDSSALKKNGFVLEKKIGPYFLYKNQAP